MDAHRLRLVDQIQSKSNLERPSTLVGVFFQRAQQQLVCTTALRASTVLVVSKAFFAYIKVTSFRASICSPPDTTPWATNITTMFLQDLLLEH